MATYGIADNGATDRGHQILDIWEGAFMSEFYGTAIQNGNGWDIYPEYGHMFHVDGAFPRTESNWQEVDSLIARAVAER